MTGKDATTRQKFQNAVMLADLHIMDVTNGKPHQNALYCENSDIAPFRYGLRDLDIGEALSKKIREEKEKRRSKIG